MTSDNSRAPAPAPSAAAQTSTPLVLPSSSPAMRGLNYFDGRFLRADDLNDEREAQRAYVELGNQAGGAGIVHGLGFSVTGSTFTVRPGLAVDAAGQVLLVDRLHEDLDVATLVAPATPTVEGGTLATADGVGIGFEACLQQPAGAVTPGSGLFAVVLERVDVTEGREDVLGRLCDGGCGSASDARSVVDAVRVRAVPVTGLDLPIGDQLGSVHERSRVATAWFDRERGGSLLTAGGLAPGAWCSGAAADATGGGVPIAIIKWDGAAVSWHDSWIVRRERMETPASRWWSRRIEMRPWSTVLAQLLQFQCQLDQVSGDVASSLVARDSARDRATARASGLTTSTQMLLDAGFVTLPPAGYLPVRLGTGQALRHELELLFGPRVDLQVCAVRRDQVAHELERAAHMDRISLIGGVQDPTHTEQVDVLVPDGVIEDATNALESRGFAVDLSLGPGFPGGSRSLRTEAASSSDDLAMCGVARLDDTSGISLRAAVAGTDPGSLLSVVRPLTDLIRTKVDIAGATAKLARLKLGTDELSVARLRDVGRATVAAGSAMRAGGRTTGLARVEGAGGTVTAQSASLWVARDPFTLASGEFAAFQVEWDVAMPQTPTYGASAVVVGRVSRVADVAVPGGTGIRLLVEGFASRTGTGIPEGSPGVPVQRTLTVTRTTTTDGRTAIRVRDADSAFLATVRYSGAPPYSGEGEIGVADETGQQVGEKAVSFTADETTDIYQAGNDYREAAIHAIQVVSALHPDNAKYVEQGFAELFPDLGTGALTVVRPVQPWVVFRRRTRTECEGAGTITTRGTSAASVRIATAADAEQATQWAEVLMSSSEGQVPWRQVRPVLFETGTASLRSSSSVWRQDYQAVYGGELIRFAGYAAASPADLPVGLSRAGELAGVTGPLGAMDPDGEVDVVTSPPSGQGVPDGQDSIWLVTYPVPVDVRVVAVNGLAEKSDPTIRAIKGGKPGGLVDAAPGVLAELVTARHLQELDEDDLATVSKALDAMAAQVPEGSAVSRDATIWVSTGLPQALQTQATTVAKEVAGQLGVEDPSVKVVDLGSRPDDEVRLYVILEQVTSRLT